MSAARDIYPNSLVWDDHCGFTVSTDSDLDALLRPWHDAGVGYLSINVYYDRQPWGEAFKDIASLRCRLSSETPYCELVSDVAGIDRARAAGRMAVAMDIEGMNALDGQVDRIQSYYDLGVRHMMIAYNRNNLAGGGCHDDDIGLTNFGRKVISEMNRVGMVVDCSHAGVSTSMDAMACSDDAVVFSHSSPRALVDHERNITDEQIKACAATGGVIGVSGVNLFLGEVEATPTAVSKHIAYIAALVGVEHVGISLDFDPEEEEIYRASAAETVMDDRGNTYWPDGAGYDRPAQTLHVRRLPDISDALVERGFDTNEIVAILGGNFRRIAEQVWK